MPITPDEFITTNPFDRLTETEDVPPYEAGDLSLDDLAAEPLPFPFTTASPAPGESKSVSQRRRRVVELLHTAVGTSNTALVTQLVQRGLVSPDATSPVRKPWFSLYNLRTPLDIAISNGNTYMTKLLLDLGADVNGWSPDPRAPTTDTPWTPLMIAAAAGRLVIVKLLMESGADDAIVAEDGQMALRLAVDSGHAEVVAFLPARRGGAMKRWKHSNAGAYKRMRDIVDGLYVVAKFFVWYVPQFFIWTLPKHFLWTLPKNLAKRIAKTTQHCWKHRAAFPTWCRKRAYELKKVVQPLPRALWRTARATPAFLRKAATATANRTWRAVKAIPTAATIVYAWLRESAARLGTALLTLLARPLALLHTAGMALLSLLMRMRAATLRDVWAAVVGVPGAVVGLARAAWRAARRAVDASYEVMGALFSTLGKVVWWIAAGVVYLLAWVPRQVLWLLLETFGVVRKGGAEFVGWVNPKWSA